MKIRSFTIHIIFSLLLVVILYSCHNNRRSGVIQPVKQSEKKSHGRIVFDKEIHNFGTLKDGEIVSFSFIFRNMGGSPLKLTNGEKSCGCLELKYSLNEVVPGESSTVEVIFNTSGEWGNVIKEATIETSDGEKKELQIGAYIENKQFNLLNTQK